MQQTPDQFSMPDIVPPSSPASPLSPRPGKLDGLKAWWWKQRYGRRPRSASRFPAVLGRSLIWLKRYWWAALPLVIIVVVALIWWGIDRHSQQQWQQATDYYRRADYAAAAPILLKQGLPQDEEKLRVYAQTMQATNHLDKSLQAYQKLYASNKDPFIKLVIGNVYNQQKDYDNAIKAYQELIDANPTYIQAYVNLATVYRLRNDNAKAIQVAQQGLTNNQSSIPLAELVVSLTADQPTSTAHQEAITKLKKLNPQDPLLSD